MRIFIFGDSITHGMWDESGGWADRLKQKINQREIETNFKNYHQVFNLGISGNTIDQLVERIETDIEPRIDEGESLFLIAIGINDSVFYQTGQEEMAPKIFQQKLEELYEIISKYTDKVFFVELTPVEESLTTPLPVSSTEKCYSNQRIIEFNAVLGEFCKKKEIPLIPVFQHFVDNDPNSLLADGLHPNEQGHALILEQVVKHIKVRLGIN